MLIFPSVKINSYGYIIDIKLEWGEGSYDITDDQL